MDPIVFAELCYCLELCERLERLFQEDLDEVSRCVTGEVHAVYSASVQDAMALLNEIKSQIKLLGSL